MFRGYTLRFLNIRLVVFVIALTILGILIIGSANEDYQSRQVLGMVIGLCLMAVAAIVSYSFLLQFHWVYYIAVLALLLGVLFFGDNVAGATRWIDIGVTRFQPSEMAKILLILFFARYFMYYSEEINKKKRLLITLGLFAVPLFLIYREPDLSTTIVTFLLLGAMLFYSGLSYKIIGVVLAVVVPAISIMLIQIYRGTESLLVGYQDTRILAWLKPDEYPQSAYQQQNSIMAIGSGQLIGKGLYNTGADSVKNGNYISEGQTDFIFAVAGEELGFIGSCILVVLLFAIAIECVRTTKKAKDLAGQLICIGVAALIGFQGFVNICVVTGLLPNTGLTLPFVSYGLTSLVTIYIGIGLVLNVSLQSKKY